MTARDVRDAWSVLGLETGPPLGEIATFMTGVVTASGEILLARDGDDRLHLLVPVTAESEVPIDEKSAGVQLRAWRLEDGSGVANWFADLVCRAPHLKDVYAHFCVEVLDAIRNGATDPVATCSAALSRWRELFRPERGPALGPDALAGLYGELTVLAEILRVDPGFDVAAWRGPDDHVHDFELPGGALEVKTTRARSGGSARINGHDQLEPPESGRLALVWMRLDADAPGGQTVPDLVDAISEAVVDRSAFLGRLARVHYHLDDSPHYRTSQYRIVVGSTSAEGIRNLLGRPKMDVLKLLVREAGQNSWDARLGSTLRSDGRSASLGTGRVRFSGNLVTLDRAAARVASSTVFASRPPKGLPLDEALRSGAHWLVIGDRGTTGLGGPTRADQTSQGEAHDFVDFIRNVGQPPDKSFGGGTFGFGKGALYLASSVSTILVYTRCRRPRGCESRLIACALGEQFAARVGASQRPHTGRHWWGRIVDGVPEPILDGEADEVARALGLDGFVGSETGTTIAVLAPDLDGRSPSATIEHLVACSLWNFWPKLIAAAGAAPDMQFHFAVDGETIPMPDPRTTAPISTFVRALDSLDGRSADGEVIVLNCKSPVVEVGRLAVQTVAVTRNVSEQATASAAAAFVGPSHHVALLRQPRLVVQYVDGPRAPSDAIEYAGVFLTEVEVDDAFAKAEPPTHDEWQSAGLPTREKRLVNSALRGIDDHLRNLFTPAMTESTGSETFPVAQLSRRLAGLLPTTNAVGASKPMKPVGKARPPASCTIRLDEEPTLVEVGSEIEATFPGTISRPARTRVVIWATVGAAVLDGGIESEPPEGAAIPHVIGWVVGGVQRDGENARVGADDGDAVEFVVRYHPTLAVAVRPAIAEDDGAP